MRAALAGVLALTAALAACGGNDAGTADSMAGASAAAAAAATADSGMAGMDHSQMAGMNRTAPKDSNQAFLRMMSDHHEGLVAMSDSAMSRITGAKAGAQQMRTKQDGEQQRMMSMLSAQYSDSLMPMIMPSHQAMVDSVTRAPQGAEADRVYYRQVIAHHREGIQMTEKMLTYLTGDVRQMAEKMIAEQRREITDLERKAARP